MRDMEAVAIIPARGGSRRLPRKNVLPFHGRPVLEYTVQAALASGCFDRVIVSSEEDEILDIGTAAGAEADHRPVELGSDTATVVSVCRDFLARETDQGRNYQRMAVLYATSPMRTAEDIRCTMALLDHVNCHYAIAATHYSHYAHQALAVSDDDFVEAQWPDLYERRPSDIGPVVCGNGSTYCVEVSTFLETSTFMGSGTRVHLMPLGRSVDIDTMEEFRLAEYLYAMPGSTG